MFSLRESTPVKRFIGKDVLGKVNVIITPDEGKFVGEQRDIQQQQKEAMELTRATSAMNTINRHTQETENKGKKEHEIKVEEVECGVES
uniref:Uncharacterized protein n=1 Tax=Glossina pallidipes TaxID=7398 RepID=A0A1A9ZXD9_GLOPL